MKRPAGSEKLPFMPDDEIAYLRQVYEAGRIILEYGSGGSTRIAAALPGKYVMSVESDLAWARALRQELAGSLSPVVLLHTDIGRTGRWGRPLDDRSWRVYHAYPNAVWDRPWFRHPDVVLIDGRFRTACLATVMLRAQQPVRVLFDDYGVRPRYQLVEQVIRPVRMVGRMAEFEITPGAVSQADMGFLIGQYFSMTVHGEGERAYQLNNGG